MPLATIGSGRIEFGSDFTGLYDSVAWGTAQLVAGEGLGNGLGFTSVNEGSFATTVDESGGILAITTDTGDNDNAAIVAGKFCPRDGKMVLRTRFKYSSATTPSIWVGFSETLALDTPVMPVEFATGTTLTVNPGGGIGLLFDIDATVDDFRALMVDGSATISDTGVLGTRASATMTADRWFEAEVILNEDGSGECWLGDSGHTNSLLMNKRRLIKRFSTGTLLTSTDLFYAVLMIENRSAAANVLEVDYFYGEGGRDWRY
ncbi:MAG TPA: hypothetical protein DCP69_07420 [Candidatus Omnitrophica bacterium]|nr:hypothetical protein [Candidatus Omnitrophota bacterium]